MNGKSGKQYPLESKNEFRVRCTTKNVIKNSPINDMIIFFVIEE